MYRWSVVVVLALLVLTSAVGLQAICTHSLRASTSAPVPPDRWTASTSAPVPPDRWFASTSAPVPPDRWFASTSAPVPPDRW